MTRVLLIALLLLAGCKSIGDILPIGPDTYVPAAT